MITKPFLVRVAGRLMRVTPLQESFTSCDDQWTPVDCRDSRTGMESQAIILTAAARCPETLLGEDQVRDAIRSAHQNATSTESGQYPGAGTRLPADFTIEVVA